MSERSGHTGGGRARRADAVVEGIEVATDHWIGGERVASSDRFIDVSPIDEQPIAEVARGGAGEADQAVTAARAATGTWGAMPPKERAEVLHRIADGVEARVPELAAVETRDNGSLLRSMRNSVMPRVARNFRFFADQLLALETGVKDYDGFAERVAWDPSGVTVVITPWNAPLMLATWRVAPALAAGNAVILKPPEWAPLTASMLADIAHDAGLPDGAFNVVQGIGEEAGAALTAHPGVDRIAFTGSIPTGKLVGELGRRQPHAGLARARGQVAVRRVRRRRPRRRRAAGREPVRQRRAGLPRRHAPDRGTQHARRVPRAVRRGFRSDRAGRPPRGDAPTSARRSRGRTSSASTASCNERRPTAPQLVFGGGPNEDLGGLYYRPTLFTDAPGGSEILTQEVFGPVLTLQTFEGEDEAIALANSTEYGLAAIVYTGDQARAERVSSALVAGTVWVNCFFVRDLAAPFGGARGSGIGREGGPWSFDFYADVKNVCTAPWN